MRCISCESYVPPTAFTCPNCGLTQVQGQGLDEYEAIQRDYLAEKQADAMELDEIEEEDIAGVLRRFAALLVDNVVISIPLTAVWWMVYFGDGALAGNMKAYYGAMGACFLYGWLLTSSPMRGTLGKHWLSISVVDLYGEQIGVGRAFVRELAKWILSPILLCTYIVALVHPMNRALHDVIARTYVIDDE